MRSEINLYPRYRHKRKPHSDYVASIIAKHYNKLREQLDSGRSGNFLSMSFEDIFQETVLYVIQDKKAFGMTETEILKHFKQKYSVIKFQTIFDSKLIHFTNADNI